ncbi:type II secretion system F family protein [Streptomyces sp. B6B3]|uniref:type II secretion system F family protein n=1 Tax=Streptomyces sp. B6B3 TaxID=3153570 RepID=UPI00325D292E
MLGCLAGGGLVALWGGSPLPLLVAGGLAPLAAARWRRWRRGRAADGRRDAVIELCGSLAGEVRAGLAPVAALAAADWAPLGEPAAGVPAAARYGGDVPAALRAGAEQPGAEGLRGVAACWQVAVDGGASLAAGLERVAAALRAERDQREELRAQLAGPRATVLTLATLPVFGLLLGAAMGAQPLRELLHTPAGLGCLAVGALLEWAGLAWTAAIIRSAERTPARDRRGGGRAAPAGTSLDNAIRRTPTRPPRAALGVLRRARRLARLAARGHSRGRIRAARLCDPGGLVPGSRGTRPGRGLPRRGRAAEDDRLPLATELLAACLAAGAAPGEAAAAVGSAFDGPVGTALRRAAAELRLGGEPAIAWGRFGQLPGADGLARRLELAHGSGAPVARVVAAEAAECRGRRLRLAQTRARRAAVYVTGPLGLCFLPAFLVTGVAPVVLGLARRLL